MVHTTATITQLADEILAHILEHVADTDLFNVRRVNRELSNFCAGTQYRKRMSFEVDASTEFRAPPRWPKTFEIWNVNVDNQEISGTVTFNNNGNKPSGNWTEVLVVQPELNRIEVTMDCPAASGDYEHEGCKSIMFNGPGTLCAFENLIRTVIREHTDHCPKASECNRRTAHFDLSIVDKEGSREGLLRLTHDEGQGTKLFRKIHVLQDTTHSLKRKVKQLEHEGETTARQHMREMAELQHALPRASKRPRRASF